MRIKKKSSISIEFFFRPGRYWSDRQLRDYHSQLTDIASDCFATVPEYQCLTGRRKDLKNNVITIARDIHGQAVGFCSAVIIEADGFNNILHLGLTCVKKSARSHGLTHKMTSKLLMRYLLKTALLKKIWVTNVACVLSSLGNVALYFEKVYPSPFGMEKPDTDHIKIARVIDKSYRSAVAINEDATLDIDAFVFRGSVDNTVFQKSVSDTRYHHRNPVLTQFYADRLDFANGDEAIQVARIGLFSYPKYMVKTSVANMLKLIPVPLPTATTARLLSKKM